MIKVKNMKIRNLVLLMGTIGISKALNANETLISTSGIIGKVTTNETNVAEDSSSQPVDSANLCISTLTLSTCTCEPRASRIVNVPGRTPIYEGDEWDRYAEIPKATSTTLSPDCVLRTNFSTNSLHHGRSSVKSETGSFVTHSSHLANETLTSSIASGTGVLSLTFPSIHVSSTRAHYYNTLTLVYHDISFHTGYHNRSISTGYFNTSSTLENESLRTQISTEEYTKSFSPSSEILITTVAETETPTTEVPTSHTLSLPSDLSAGQEVNTVIEEEEYSTTHASESEIVTTSTIELSESIVPSLTLHNNVTSRVNSYPISTVETTQEYGTEDHQTVYETTHESIESSSLSSLETGVTMETSLRVHHHSTTSHKMKTSHTSYSNKPTTQPGNSWSDYWSDENWSEEWPSEFWSDVFKETSTTRNPTHSKSHSEPEKHSTSSSKRPTHTRWKSHNEHRSTVQSFVSSTDTTEGSFTILPTSRMQSSHSAKHSSHGHNTEESHTQEPPQHTEEHHTEEHHTEEHHTEEHHTEENHTEEHHTEETMEIHSSSISSTVSETSEHIHKTSESQYQITSNSKEQVYSSSTSEGQSIPTLTSSMPISSQLSPQKNNSYTSERSSKSPSSTSMSTGPSLSTSTHRPTKFSTGSSHRPNTTNYPKRNKLTGTSSISAEITASYSSLSRTYPRKKSYSPVFTLKPAPSVLSLGNTEQLNPLLQTSSEETETETETLYITILSSTATLKSTVQSSYPKHPSSSETSTVSVNENTSSSLARPYHILKPNEETETTSSESNASKTTTYYLLFIPSFILLVLL